VAHAGAALPEGFELDNATGLGLSIVRTLVTSDLAGEITIRSGDGEGGRPGTRVALRVPVGP
jgi:two-component sensor histidine kinase